jgi:hypothetical protein
MDEEYLRCLVKENYGITTKRKYVLSTIINIISVIKLLMKERI